MPLPPVLILATANPGKLEEWARLLAPLGIRIEPWRGPSPPEDATSVQGNARLKALHAAQQAGTPALGDDVGLWVDALGGAPGLELKRWAMARGGWEQAKAELYRSAAGSRATYRCGLALATPGGAVQLSVGEIEGTIVEGIGPGPGLQPCVRLDPPPDTPPGVAPHRALALRRLLAVLQELRSGPPDEAPGLG